MRINIKMEPQDAREGGTEDWYLNEIEAETRHQTPRVGQVWDLMISWGFTTTTNINI